MLRLTKQGQHNVPQVVHVPDTRGCAEKGLRPRAKPTITPAEAEGIEFSSATRDQFSNPKTCFWIKNFRDIFNTYRSLLR